MDSNCLVAKRFELCEVFGKLSQDLVPLEELAAQI